MPSPVEIPVKIANNTVVSFHYKLEEIGGDYKEDSTGGDPVLYLHGHRGVLPGLEDAMKGRVAGEMCARRRWKKFHIAMLMDRVVISTRTGSAGR